MKESRLRRLWLARAGRPRRRRRLEPGINLTPLLDAIFNLIFFFILATTIRQDLGRFNVRLPAASTAAAVKPEGVPTLVIGEDGRVSMEDRAMGDAELELVLREMAGRGEKRVMIRGDERVELGRAVAVWDLCRRAGLENTDLLTRPGSPAR